MSPKTKRSDAVEDAVSQELNQQEVQMSETINERIDIDLDGVNSPFATLPEGTYDLTLKEIKQDVSQKGHPMLRCLYVAQHPETNETVFIRDYPLLDQQSGKFRLKQLIIGSGQSPERGAWSLGAMIGTSYSAEVDVQTSEEFGDQNRIKRLWTEI